MRKWKIGAASGEVDNQREYQRRGDRLFTATVTAILLAFTVAIIAISVAKISG